MKAIVDATILGKELKKISPVIGKNVIMPILEHVLLKFNKKELVLTGTDLNTTISIQMECDCKKEFTVVMVYADLCDICERSAGPITISNEEKIIRVSNDKATFKLTKGGFPEEFPVIENADYFNVVSVDGAFFYSLNGANTCRSKNHMQSSLCNIGVDFNKTNLTVIGVDSFIMHKKEVPVSCKKNVVVAVESNFALLTKFFQDSTLSVSEKFIMAEYDKIKVISRLAEAPYCAYKSIIPESIEYNFFVNRVDLMNNISMVGVTSERKSRSFVINFNKTGIKMASSDIDHGKESELEMIVEHTVDIPAICLNGGQLLTVLGTVNCDNIKMCFSAHDRSVYIQPEDDDTTLLLIQPLLLNQ